MQIEIFTICDNAQVYAGKAVVMGAFNQLNAKKLPVVVPNFTLAVRVSFEKEESGDKTFYFFINKPDGTSLIPELRCETKQLIQPDTQDQLITYDMNIVLGHVVLNQFGCYTVTMRFEDKTFLLKFYVREVK